MAPVTIYAFIEWPWYDELLYDGFSYGLIYQNDSDNRETCRHSNQEAKVSPSPWLMIQFVVQNLNDSICCDCKSIILSF